MSIGYLFFCLISESQRLRRCDATLQVTVPCLRTGVLSPSEEARPQRDGEALCCVLLVGLPLLGLRS